MKSTICMLALGLLMQRPDAERIKQQLIGSYRLVSYVSYDQSGAERKMPYVHGQISYDAAGRMSAQLMGSDRPQFGGGGGRGTGGAGQAGAGRGAAATSTEAQRAAAYSSYVAYFGRYTLDAEKGIVTHHVEGSLTPSMVGSAMPRWYEFSPDGSTLYLMTKSGDRVTGRLRWDRYR